MSLDHLYLSPDFQVITHARGREDADTEVHRKYKIAALLLIYLNRNLRMLMFINRARASMLQRTEEPP
jgi:hypothetical protein